MTQSHNADGTLKSSAITSSGANATTTSTGLIQLAGDLAGTATSPTVPALASKANDSAVVHKSDFTAKGTLIGGTGASIYASLSVGSDTQLLTADSTQTTGLKWVNKPTSGIIYAVDYGAVFNGSTDDAAALQSAIAAAVSTGKPLMLSPGTAIIGTSLSISAPITIVGAGSAATILKAKNSLNDFIIKFTGGSAGVGIVSAVFMDFTLDGNLANQTAGGGILASGAVQCVFERLPFTSCYNWGLELGPITGGAFGHHNRVFNCLFDNSGTSTGYGGGTWTTSSDENWFILCDFENLGGASAPTGTSPIMLYDLAGLQCIIGCNFVGGSNNCIAVRIQNCKETKVISSTFDNTAGDSVFMVANSCTVTGNVFAGPGTVGSTPASGVNLEFNTHFNIISGNSLVTSDITGKTRSLIREESTGGAGDNLLEGNGMSWGASGPTVALLETGGTNTIVRNNIGWKTENTGTATVLSGTTSIAVSHGLDTTPALANLSVTPTNSLGSATRFWISGVTNTSFTINVDVNPGATTATFAWAARM
ncbi:MAG TPA: glycosyl hydrolase family 28-related protein [Candidatus Chromulinivoraceae bacterium]|nr:glycosyl hydrolase family 28-related protein [Candidatus Chromulinivoraceae bacterium]